MSKSDDALSLQQLRVKYPEVKAVSKKAFLLKLKSMAAKAAQPTKAEAAPPKPEQAASGGNVPDKPEKPAEGKKKGSTAQKPPFGKLSECALQYKEQNSDFIEELRGEREGSLLIAGDERAKLYKVLFFKGKYGPTQTLHASRGKSLEAVRAIAKTF